MPRKTKKSSGIVRFFAAIFTPPFVALPVAVWIYFVWCFLVYPHSPVLAGNLPDSDDYMYLDQILDWLRGQGWYDNVQGRLDPPDGTLIVFSRLAELPMAGLTLLFSQFINMQKAALLTAMVIPPCLLALLLIVLQKAALPFVNKKWSRATAFVALFASYLIYQFSPGHLDHHNLTALLVLVAFWLATQMMQKPNSLMEPILAGITLGYAMVVGLEVLPALMLISGWLGLWAMAKGKATARSLVIYGAALVLSSGFFLAVTSAPSDIMTLDALRFSVVYVLLAAGIYLCCVTVFLASKTRYAWLRYVAGFVTAAVTGVFYLKTFPALVIGPYGAMNADLAHLMFSTITEAQPAVRLANSPVGIFLYAIWPLMALVAAIIFLWNTQNKKSQWLWGMAALLLAAHLLLGMLYQIRFLVFAQLFSIIPLTAFLERGSVWIGKNCKGRSLGLMQIGLVLLIAPLPMLVMPAAISNSQFNTGILLFPVATAEYECDMQSVAAEINRKGLCSANDVPVMNEMESGPELLYRTFCSGMAAPFHTDVNGNLEAAQFFGATSVNSAANVLNHRKAKLVLLCNKIVPLYHRADGKITLAERLGKGDVPSWLKPIHYAGEGDYMLFEAAE